MDASINPPEVVSNKAREVPKCVEAVRMLFRYSLLGPLDVKMK